MNNSVGTLVAIPTYCVYMDSLYVCCENVLGGFGCDIVEAGFDCMYISLENVTKEYMWYVYEHIHMHNL